MRNLANPRSFSFLHSDEIYRYFSSWREMLHCKKVLSSTSGIVETDLFMGKNIDEEQRLENSVKFVEKQLSPRFIKTHISLDLLPTIENSDCKVYLRWHIFENEYRLQNLEWKYRSTSKLAINIYGMYVRLTQTVILSCRLSTLREIPKTLLFPGTISKRKSKW